MAIGTRKQVKAAVSLLAVLGGLVVIGGLWEWYRQRRGLSAGPVVEIKSSGGDSDATLVTSG